MKYLLAVVFLLCVGCDDCSERPFQPISYTNVVRVFKNGPWDYSIQTMDPETKRISDVNFHFGIRDTRYKLFADVPAGEPMWAKVEAGKEARYSPIVVEIHMHDPGDTDGGSWIKRVGKSHYKENTQVVE